MQLQSHPSADSKLDSWPKGPYCQQIQGILPPMLTDDIILTHLQISGKQLKPQKQKSAPANIDYTTLQRGHASVLHGRLHSWKACHVLCKRWCYLDKSPMLSQPEEA